MTTDEKIDKLLTLFQEESELNNSRYQGVNQRLDNLEGELKGEINKVFMTLSQDIQVFAIDLEKVKRRVDRKLCTGYTSNPSIFIRNFQI